MYRTNRVFLIMILVAVPCVAEERGVVDVFVEVLEATGARPSLAHQAMLQEIIDRRKTRGPIKTLALALKDIDGRVPARFREHLEQLAARSRTPQPIRTVAEVALRFDRGLSESDRELLSQLRLVRPQPL